ncbi:hypothetical protein WKI68_07570 [Streptomyces sp. MS1.HAVA.3]|uniref:Uncharacterized protein n=1 Tax=Streptomyces caledonius TaxID=3134107 RepID=A0ABU8U0F4_9ACTN
MAGGPASHVPQDGVAELVHRIPDARMTTIPVGHLVHAAAPEEFVREVAAFLDCVPDGVPDGMRDSAPDDVSDGELARRWLAAEGVTRTGEDEWTDGGSEDGRLTSNEVAHAFAGAAVRDDSLDVEGRIRLGFGLVDLLDAYRVTVEIGSAVQGAEDPRAARALWDGYRSRLEAPEVSEAVTYSLWVDWFEDRDTADTAFAEVLGKDVGQLRPGARSPCCAGPGAYWSAPGRCPGRSRCRSTGPPPWCRPCTTRSSGPSCSATTTCTGTSTRPGARPPRRGGTAAGHRALGRAAHRTGGRSPQPPRHPGGLGGGAGRGPGAVTRAGPPPGTRHPALGRSAAQPLTPAAGGP